MHPILCLTTKGTDVRNKELHRQLSGSDGLACSKRLGIQTRSKSSDRKFSLSEFPREFNNQTTIELLESSLPQKASAWDYKSRARI
jgi:hypothetical protein